MAVIKINALTVPENSGEELAQRFASRAGAVDGQDGFEGFELLRPTDGRNQWLVVTRWRDEAAFAAWLQSPSFLQGHAGLRQEESSSASRPTLSELWSYEVTQSSETVDH
jgi:heme-degrading monooxygenase HmoA